MRGSALLVVVAFIVQMTSCGTIIYPERRGQTSGQLDVGIVLLDAVGLLFFIIPGIVAYAVDFSTGAIYLPPGEEARVPATLDSDEMTVIRLDPEALDRETIRETVAAHIGRDVDLDSATLRVYEIDENGRFVPRDGSRPIPYQPRSARDL